MFVEYINKCYDILKTLLVSRGLKPHDEDYFTSKCTGSGTRALKFGKSLLASVRDL